MSMHGQVRGILCERARGWAALLPDGELSELERKLLASHLSRCSACGGFAAEVAAVAAELRQAPPVPLARPISLPVWRHRRLAYARFRAVGAAAAVAAMALGVAARAPLDPGTGKELPRVTNYADNAEREVALIARQAEARQLDPTRLRPEPEGGITSPI